MSNLDSVGSRDDSDTLKIARMPRLLIKVALGGDGAVLVAVTVLCEISARYRRSRFLRILTLMPEFASIKRVLCETGVRVFKVSLAGRRPTENG